jgi:ribonuclease VapC
MNSYVLDASAILAFLNNEPGADRVQAVLSQGRCFISVVNWSEVARKLVLKRLPVEPVAQNLLAVGVEFRDFDYQLAIATAQIEAQALSLGDRACLSLACGLGATALTADTIWQSLVTGINVELIR